MTEAELRLCRALEGILSGTVPMAHLNAQTRAMARRMMIKGILHRRDKRFARLTKRGRTAYVKQSRTNSNEINATSDKAGHRAEVREDDKR